MGWGVFVGVGGMSVGVGSAEDAQPSAAAITVVTVRASAIRMPNADEFIYGVTNGVRWLVLDPETDRTGKTGRNGSIIVPRLNGARSV